MMDTEAAKLGLSLLDRGEDFAWVTILETWGSAPRHAGADMLVRTDGSIAGTIGGGPLEATMISRALDAIRSGRSSLQDFEGSQLGMRCGGGGLVLVERVDARRPAARDLFRRLVGLLEEGGNGWLVTVVRRDAGEGDRWPPSRRCLIDSAGAVAGDPVHSPDDLRELARRGGAAHPTLPEGATKTYVDSVGARGKAYVFGAGHCAQKLVPVLSVLRFFTVVVDDRPDFARTELFPNAGRVVLAESFDGVMKTLPIDDDSYLIIVTRGHSHDQALLAQSLPTPARYIGMIGSSKKVADTFKVLGEMGFSSKDLARIHAPIGLPIGAETPEEIAISIAAQMVQVRSGLGATKA